MHTAADVQTITKVRRTPLGAAARRFVQDTLLSMRPALFASGAAGRIPTSDWPVWSAERKTDECNGNEECKGMHDTQGTEGENGIDSPI